MPSYLPSFAFYPSTAPINPPPCSSLSLSLSSTFPPFFSILRRRRPRRSLHAHRTYNPPSFNSTTPISFQSLERRSRRTTPILSVSDISDGRSAYDACCCHDEAPPSLVLTRRVRARRPLGRASANDREVVDRKCISLPMEGVAQFKRRAVATSEEWPSPERRRSDMCGGLDACIRRAPPNPHTCTCIRFSLPCRRRRSDGKHSLYTTCICLGVQVRSTVSTDRQRSCGKLYCHQIVRPCVRAHGRRRFTAEEKEPAPLRIVINKRHLPPNRRNASC